MVLSIHSVRNHQLAECLPSSSVCTRYPPKDESSMPWTLRKPVIYERTWGPSRLFFTGSFSSNGLFALKSISICLSVFLFGQFSLMASISINQFSFTTFVNFITIPMFITICNDTMYLYNLFFASNYWISIMYIYTWFVFQFFIRFYIWNQ